MPKIYHFNETMKGPLGAERQILIDMETSMSLVPAHFPYNFALVHLSN